MILTRPKPYETKTHEQEGFQKASETGEQAEDLVLSYFREQGADIVDLRDDLDSRRRDIDFIINGFTVDVKGDTHTSGNLFLSDAYTSGKLGRFWGSRAEVWVYVFLKTGDAYLIPLPRMQRYVGQHYSELRYVGVRGNQEGRSVGASGLLLPIGVALRECGVQHLRLS